MVYTMHVEKPAGIIKMHGFHLGTDLVAAERIVLDRLRADPGVLSIALRADGTDIVGSGKLVAIYDFRDLAA